MTHLYCLGIHLDNKTRYNSSEWYCCRLILIQSEVAHVIRYHSLKLTWTLLISNTWSGHKQKALNSSSALDVWKHLQTVNNKSIYNSYIQRQMKEIIIIYVFIIIIVGRKLLPQIKKILCLNPPSFSACMLSPCSCGFSVGTSDSSTAVCPTHPTDSI